MIGAAPLTPGVTVALTLKKTSLSTTFSSAVWLFSTLSLGLERILTEPKDSRRLMLAAMLPTGEVGLVKLRRRKLASFVPPNVVVPLLMGDRL